MAIYRLADGETIVGMASRVSPQHQNKGVAAFLEHFMVAEIAQQYALTKALWVASITKKYRKYADRLFLYYPVELQRIFVSVAFAKQMEFFA